MARSITQFSPTSHTLPITRKVARFSPETRRELSMEPSPMTTKSIADAQRHQQQDRIAVLAGLLCDYCPDVPDEARRLRFTQFPSQVRDTFLRRAKIALGLVDTAREAQAQHAATRTVEVALVGHGKLTQDEARAIARTVSSAVIGVYLDVLALEPQAHDPRRRTVDLTTHPAKVAGKVPILDEMDLVAED